MHKQKAVEDFNKLYPDCSRKTIEKKIGQLFVKEKLDGEPKVRWFASEDTLIEHNMKNSEVLKEISRARHQEMVQEMQKIQEEQEKKK
jgi:hypothetical protein